MTKHNLNVTSWNYKKCQTNFYHQMFSDRATYEHQIGQSLFATHPPVVIILGVRS